jgi:hypothetical protein
MLEIIRKRDGISPTKPKRRVIRKKPQLVTGALAPGQDPSSVEGPFSTSIKPRKRRASEDGDEDDDELGVRAPPRWRWRCVLRRRPAL